MNVKNKNDFIFYNDKYTNLNVIDVRKNCGFKYKNLNIYQKLTGPNNKDERCYLKSFNSPKKVFRNTHNKKSSPNINTNYTWSPQIRTLLVRPPVRIMGFSEF